MKDAYATLTNDTEGMEKQELCHFRLSQMEGTSMLVGVMVRRGAYWSFVPLGKSCEGRNINEILQVKSF